MKNSLVASVHSLHAFKSKKFLKVFMPYTMGTQLADKVYIVYARKDLQSLS